MKQVFQNVRSAEVRVEEVPAPKLLAGCVLVRTAASLVSAGTERTASEFAGGSLLRKAQMRPDLVREVLNKLGRDGWSATISTVRSRLDQPSALGYSSAGMVMAVGEGVDDLRPGDRVACGGTGNAIHAEFACVPRLLAARILSDSISFDEAAFTTLGAIALHGIRNAEAKLGDVVAVIGLGLLGQLCVQILKAAGCVVLGMDISRERAQIALRSGADAVSTSAAEFSDLCMQMSSGHGADAVVIAAQSASSDPVNLAGAVARHRATVVAVGTVAMDIPRRTFYEKEIEFRVSRSYGPGRYDAKYEEKGIDYPIGYVRWTETRNMEAFLKLAADGKLHLRSLITHCFPIERANAAYELITGNAREPFLGVVIEYAEDAAMERKVEIASEASRAGSSEAVRIGFLGAGSFALNTLLPAIQRESDAEMVVVAAASGAHARHAADKFGFRTCTTHEEDVLENSVVNTIVIATRHHLHAEQVIAALRAGRNVFCEKPLCLNRTELEEIALVKAGASGTLMVGFNRRFSPMVVRMKEFLQDVREPMALHYRVNAGFLAADHWLNDREQGGGRILGEVCHFVDLLSFLAGSNIIEVEARALANSGRYSNDNILCSLKFANGSQGTISYLANGDRAYSKERIEVFGGGNVAVLEDFRKLEVVRGGRRKIWRSRFRQDKGHEAEWKAFAEAIRKGAESPIAFDEIAHTMLATFALEESRCVGGPVRVLDLQSESSRDARIGQAS